jgi:hypothetical protein
MILVAGPTTEEDKNKLAPYVNAPRGMIIGNAKVHISCCNTHSCSPTMFVGTGTTDSPPFAKVQGPGCYCGCSQLCREFHFRASKPGSAMKTGDLADIVKKKVLLMCIRRWSLMLTFSQPRSKTALTPEQKATLLGTLLLTD